MGGNFELDGKVFNLKLGKSFDPAADVAFHSIRCKYSICSNVIKVRIFAVNNILLRFNLI